MRLTGSRKVLIRALIALAAGRAERELEIFANFDPPDLPLRR